MSSNIHEDLDELQRLVSDSAIPQEPEKSKNKKKRKQRNKKKAKQNER